MSGAGPPRTKGEGAPPAPIPKLLNSLTTTASPRTTQACETNVDRSALICSAWCSHPITRIDLANGIHHAKEVCAGCGRVLRWLPKPVTIERQQSNSFRIAKLSMQEGLTRWERKFLASIAQKNRLSPRQQQVLDKLAEKWRTP
jgi:hypothetical protein